MVGYALISGKIPLRCTLSSIRQQSLESLSKLIASMLFVYVRLIVSLKSGESYEMCHLQTGENPARNNYYDTGT